MKLIETPLKGAYIIEIERIEDERGFFATTFSRKDFEARGIDSNFVQCNMSYNKKKGTLRGMHFQKPPHEQAKLVSCVRGSMFDVMVDLRRDSPTFRKWFGVQLDGGGGKLLFVPKGFAHGFETLEDDTVILYQISDGYHPESEGGARWNDSLFTIEWPINPTVISERDMKYPDFEK